MEVENESQIIDEITEANNKEVVTIHSNQLAHIQEGTKPRDNLGSDLKSEVSIKEESSEISRASIKEIDLRGSNPKIVAANEEKSKPKPKKKKSDKVNTMRDLVKKNYSTKDYRKFMDIGKDLKSGGEKDYCAALVGILRSNQKIMHQYIELLPPKIQQMCIDAMHTIAMEQSDESEVHELSQDMINNAERPATRSTTGPLVFGLQKQILVSNSNSWTTHDLICQKRKIRILLLKFCLLGEAILWPMKMTTEWPKVAQRKLKQYSNVGPY